MNLEALTPAAPPHRRFHDFRLDSCRLAKRSKRGSDHDEHLAGGEASASTSRIYKCSVCGKVFPSHQALGGHKASHRTKPPTNAVGKPSSSTSADAANFAAAAPGRLHTCSTCGRSFPSGQALGGHMRKHYGGDRPFNGAASFSSGGAAVSYSYGNRNDDQMTVISNNLDLNLPPSRELDLTLKL